MNHTILCLAVSSCMLIVSKVWAGDDAQMLAQARAALWELTTKDETWVKIHAAEVLIAFGDAARVRQFFLEHLDAAEVAPYKVGAWRVLAATAPSLEERDKWIEKIAGIAFGEHTPNPFGAIETLCKLGYRPGGPRLEAMRTLAKGAADGVRAMPLWSLQLAGDADALNALADGLSLADSTGRLCSAYALRWLRPTDAAVLRKLAAAADREPANSPAYAYILSAALATNADSARARDWQSKLEHLPEEVNEANRFEAAYALLPSRTEADLPEQAKLLAPSGKDVCVGAAWTILFVSAHHTKN